MGKVLVAGRLTPRWSARVINKVPSPTRHSRGAQLHHSAQVGQLGVATVLKIKRADLRSPATGFSVSASH